MLKPSAHRFATLIALAAAAMLGGCDGGDIEINGQKGVPLSEVEIAGPPPTEVFLASGDTVILTEGDTFAIRVEGSDTESLRFVRDSEVIGITREDGWNGKSAATIRITMPAPTELVISGAGTIKAPALASEADINIGGSGTVEFGKFAGQTLGINIGGSGKVIGAGTAKELEILIGGRGEVEMPGLKADTAEITIGGSGDIAFASDGRVKANIGGAGDVRVAGKAKCTINAMGSGTLTCTPTSSGATASLPAPAAKPAE
ncbi:MAG: head GIN domain-containing protein [Erythrobacter sp.]